MTEISLEIGRGEAIACDFLLGEGESAAATAALLERYRIAGAIDLAFEESRSFWRPMERARYISI